MPESDLLYLTDEENREMPFETEMFHVETYRWFKVEYTPRENQYWHFLGYKLLDNLHYSTEYADDIFKTLLESEKTRVYVNYANQQFRRRTALLNLIKKAANKCKLLQITMHLAIYYLDVFLDSFIVQDNMLNLATITCILIAAKIEEMDTQIPQFQMLNSLVNDTYTKVQLKQFEFNVLSTLHFNLIRPTVATFAEYFAKSIITLADYTLYVNNWHNGKLEIKDFKTFNNNNNESWPTLYDDYESLLNVTNDMYFNIVNATLNYIYLTNVAPSVIAASCIAVVRRLLCIAPTWTAFIENLTGYKEEKISVYEDTIILLYTNYGKDTSYETSESFDDNNLDLFAFENVVEPTVREIENLNCDGHDHVYHELENQLYYKDDYPIPTKRRRKI